MDLLASVSINSVMVDTELGLFVVIVVTQHIPLYASCNVMLGVLRIT